MSNQEHNAYTPEQAQALEKFHDRFAHQKSPDWLRDEGKAGEKDDLFTLGDHTAQLSKLGALMLSEAGMRMTLSAEETYTLLMWLYDNHRDTLYALTHPHQNQER